MRCASSSPRCPGRSNRFCRYRHHRHRPRFANGRSRLSVRVHPRLQAGRPHLHRRAVRRGATASSSTRPGPRTIPPGVAVVRVADTRSPWRAWPPASSDIPAGSSTHWNHRTNGKTRPPTLWRRSCARRGAASASSDHRVSLRGHDLSRRADHARVQRLQRLLARMRDMGAWGRRWKSRPTPWCFTAWRRASSMSPSSPTSRRTIWTSMDHGAIRRGQGSTLSGSGPGPGEPG